MIEISQMRKMRSRQSSLQELPSLVRGTARLTSSSVSHRNVNHYATLPCMNGC